MSEKLSGQAISELAKLVAEYYDVNILIAAAKTREYNADNTISFIAPPEVLKAMEEGLPYDKSKVKATLLENQNELDKIIGATLADKLKRRLK